MRRTWSRDLIAEVDKTGGRFKQTNNAAYEEAVKLLLKIRELMVRLELEAEFEDYLVALRVEYKRKRNLMKMLDESF